MGVHPPCPSSPLLASPHVRSTPSGSSAAQCDARTTPSRRPGIREPEPTRRTAAGFAESSYPPCPSCPWNPDRRCTACARAVASTPPPRAAAAAAGVTISRSSIVAVDAIRAAETVDDGREHGHPVFVRSILLARRRKRRRRGNPPPTVRRRSRTSAGTSAGTRTTTGTVVDDVILVVADSSSAREVPRVRAAPRPSSRGRRRGDAQHGGVERPQGEPRGGSHGDVRGVREVQESRERFLLLARAWFDAVGARVRFDAAASRAFDDVRLGKIPAGAVERAVLARAAVRQANLEELHGKDAEVAALRCGAASSSTRRFYRRAFAPARRERQLALALAIPSGGRGQHVQASRGGVLGLEETEGGGHCAVEGAEWVVR